MNFEHANGRHLLPNGRVIPNAASIWDAGSTLHLNVIPWQGKLWCFYIGGNQLVSRGGAAGQIGAFTLDVSQGNAFDGIRYEKVNGGNPLITFNAATVPPPFNVADVPGASIRNLAVGELNGELWLYFVTKGAVAVTPGDDEPSNPGDDDEGITDEPEEVRARGAFRSSDGINWTWVGELQWNGGTWDGAMTGLWTIGNRMYGLISRTVGTRRKARSLRSTLDGMSWVDHGIATNLPDDPLSYEAFTQVQGRVWTEGNYSYALLPGSSWHHDWPEAIGLYRIANALLGTPNAMWERYGRNPVFQRSAQEGGVWQLFPFRVGADWWGLYNTWGPRPGYQTQVNSESMNRLRAEVYHRPVNWSFKHVGVARLASTLALDDWSREPLDEADAFLIRQDGRYVACTAAVNDGNLTLIEDPEDPRARWRFQRHSDYWLIVADTAPTLAIRPRGAFEQGVADKDPANMRALDQTMRLGLWANALNGSPVTQFHRQAFHWIVSIRGTEPTRAMFWNRYTSLAIDNRLRAAPPHWGDARFTFDLLPLIPGALA